MSSERSCWDALATSWLTSAMEDCLGDAGAVAQVDKYDAAVVADGVYPADEGGRLADVRSAQFAAGMSAV